MGRVVFHIARRQDWEVAQTDGEYRVSTLGRSLSEVGFIHCSVSREQVLAVASAFYASVSEPLVRLTIDVERVGTRYATSSPATHPSRSRTSTDQYPSRR